MNYNEYENFINEYNDIYNNIIKILDEYLKDQKNSNVSNKNI